MTTTPRLWKSQTQVNTTDNDHTQFEQQIAALPDGGYVVVWGDFSFTYNPLGEAIVGQRYDSAGNKVGGEVFLSQFNTSGDLLLESSVVVIRRVDLRLGFPKPRGRGHVLSSLSRTSGEKQRRRDPCECLA
jgi:hypothetical protein